MNFGDYSRFTFEPSDNVRTVMIKQGGLVSDSDVNEASEVTLRRIETEAVDVIGTEGAPLLGGGFRIVPDGGTLTVAESADPRNAAGASANVQNAPFAITAGRIYLNGLQIENHQMCGPLELAPPGDSRYPSQPMPLPANTLSGNGNRLVFLRAVIDHATPVEWPRLLEPALGDADTSNRAIVSWQVGVIDAGAAAACGDPVPEWADTIAPSSGRMVISLDAAAPSTDPCKLTPGAGYVRPENLFYRVQVEDGTVVRNCADGPRFNSEDLRLKISRNNALEVARIVKMDGDALTITPSSRDGVPTFRQGGWIEFLADGAEARGDAAAGWTQIQEVNGDVVKVASAAGAAEGNRIRLWSVDIVTVPAGGSAAIDGIIRFTPTGEWRRGDYIVVPARYGVGQEYWDRYTGRALAPFGPRIEYAKLAMVTLNADVVQQATDCRATFEPLTQLLSFHYAGGDGQTVTPVGVAPGGFADAPSELCAGVRVGRKPAVGSLVKFELLPTPAPATAGQLTRTGGGPGPAQDVSVIAETGPDGVARVTWSLNLDDTTQRVRATLLDANDPNGLETLPLPIEYSAGLNRAALTGYTPGACAGLNGVDNVQSALDKLCDDIANIKPQVPPVLIVTDVIAPASGAPVENNITLKPADLLEGLVVSFDDALGIHPEGHEPIMRVWIDLPHPDPAERVLWQQMGYSNQTEWFGTIPLHLRGWITVENGNQLRWQPRRPSKMLLETWEGHRFGMRSAPQLQNNPNEYDPLLKTYLTIQGNSVWSESDDPRKYLNGEALMYEDGGNRFTMRPRRFDPQRAADYRLWFFLEVPPP